MMTKRFFVTGFLLTLLSGLLLVGPTHAQIFDDDPLLSEDEVKELISEPQPRITIPGLDFSELSTDPDDFVTEGIGPDGRYNRYLNIPFLGQYIGAIYRFGVITLGVAAIAYLFRGGLIIAMSGGRAEDMTQAKDVIRRGTVGLLIGIGSYIILFTINPELVRFQNLRVQYIQGVDIVDVVGDLTQDLAADELNDNIPFNPQGQINVPYFSQRGDRTPFGACSDVGYSGCGPTSLAMVLKYYGWDVTPGIMATQWAALGYRRCKNPPPEFNIAKGKTSCGGCSNHGHNGMFTNKQFLSKYKMKSEFLGRNKEKVLARLKAKIPVIASTRGPSVFTKKAHLLVLTGVNDDGTISINDPNKKAYCNPDKYQKPTCPSSDRTISANKVPADLLFTYLKAATALTRQDGFNPATDN